MMFFQKNACDVILPVGEGECLVPLCVRKDFYSQICPFRKPVSPELSAVILVSHTV